METKEFISIFNEYYPFERYVVKNPHSINYLFDDVKLTEVFVPSTEIKPITYINSVTGKEEYMCHTRVNNDEIYVKLKCKGVAFRMALYDFDDKIRETIIEIVLEDIGGLNWQSLYIEYEDGDEEENELKEILKEQKILITEKYGECDIKPNFKVTNTLSLLEQISNE